MKPISEFRPIIIGIDHGYGNIKTAHKIFLTGADRLHGGAIINEHILSYQDEQWVIGENHLTYSGEKTSDKGFYILTLAAIAEELQTRGFTDANVVIAAGLPLAWITTQRKAFKEYLSQDADPVFTYKEIPYHLHIHKVLLFPQAIAAASLLGELKGEHILADIGNGTMNIVRIVDGMPQEKDLATETYGVSILVRQIRGILSKKLGRNVEERVIERILREGSGATEDDLLSGTITETAREYSGEIIKRLNVYGYDPAYCMLHIFGGGGCLLKNYSDLSQASGVTFYDDLCANAKGFELLAESKLKLMGER